MKTLIRFCLGLFVGMALTASTIYGYHFIYDYEPSIVVHGELTDDEKLAVVETVSSAVERSGRWVSSLGLAESLLELSWIRDVSIARSLDNRINVNVDVKNFMARVDSETALTEHGEVIQTVREPPSYLPTVQGYPLKQSSTDVATLKKVRARFALAGEKVSLFELTDEGWHITLETGHTVLLGDSDLVARAGRFLRIHRELDLLDEDTIIVADARYNHGVAVRTEPRHRVSPSDSDIAVETVQRE
ncbi:MAG: cell division protein FtsQ/DivIB [Gammaproteobacteria bacterium]|nr:cell division protein FtsQ/DivIB [Gammaproteobacteria bacterium]